MHSWLEEPSQVRSKNSDKEGQNDYGGHAAEPIHPHYWSTPCHALKGKVMKAEVRLTHPHGREFPIR